MHPTRESAHGYRCFPSLSELPDVPDAVVVAIPAAGVPDVVDEAGELGCGGAVVYGAGLRRGRPRRGARASGCARSATRHQLPVCGPNGNGIVAVALAVPRCGATPWRRSSPGRSRWCRRAATSRSTRSPGAAALRFHTVVSCGNATVVDPAEWVRALARDDEVRSIALYLEADGDGALLCEALAECAARGVGVAMLKVGESTAGAAAATAHTGALAGDQRVFRALVEEAGAAWADGPPRPAGARRRPWR